jgi:hypothetical protein
MSGFTRSSPGDLSLQKLLKAFEHHRPNSSLNFPSLMDCLAQCPPER